MLDPTKIAELKQKLPSYASEKQTQKQNIENLNKEIKSKSLYQLSPSARLADPSLPKAKSGVVKFDLVEKKVEKKIDPKTGKEKQRTIEIAVKNIPALNIGEESKISANEWKIPELEKLKLQHQNAKALDRVKTISEKDLAEQLKFKILEVKNAKDIKINTMKSLGLKKERFEAMKYSLKAEQNMSFKEIKEFDAETMQLLEAMIMFESGDRCHLAAGLYQDLLKSKNDEIKAISNLHLGICAHKMGLYVESVNRLLTVIQGAQSTNEFKVEALDALLEDVPFEFEAEVSKVLESAGVVSLVPEKRKNTYHYIIAKGAIKNKNFSSALANAQKVESKNKHYYKAQYIASVAEYMQDNVQAAMERQQKIKSELEKLNDKDAAVHTLVSLNLARLSFQKNRYSDSIKIFREIDRKHPLWLQGVQEQAWAQLLTQDEPGAIGNMHSIHSPFFDSVFKPESYVIRSIGYLNLCHYGDAYKTLSVLESKYRPQLEQMGSFAKNNEKNIKNYYDTVLTYLKNPKLSEVNSLNYVLIREMARHKDYLNVQDSINRLVDENEQYNFLISVIDNDKQKTLAKKASSLKRIKDIEAKIAMAKKQNKSVEDMKQFNQLKQDEIDLQAYYAFELITYDKAKKGLKSFELESRSRLNERKSKLQMQAARILQKRMNAMMANVKEVLNNNEFLRYEVFAGSGENIRFHSAGGKVEEKRIPASAVPQKKDLKWSYDGEFWADEVGYYRSALKSNCGKTN